MNVTSVFTDLAAPTECAVDLVESTETGILGYVWVRQGLRYIVTLPFSLLQCNFNHCPATCCSSHLSSCAARRPGQETQPIDIGQEWLTCALPGARFTHTWEVVPAIPVALVLPNEVSSAVHFLDSFSVFSFMLAWERCKLHSFLLREGVLNLAVCFSWIK